MKNEKAKNAALFGLMIALAFTLGYLESLIPVNLGIPGVKLGIANIVVLTSIYVLGEKKAFVIAVIRILLAGLTFGNTYSLIYSLCGGLFSFAVMCLMKRTKLSTTGVSISGGVSHNIGQILAAAFLMGTTKIVYYLPILLVAGVVTGTLIGLVSSLIINRLNKLTLSTKGENYDKRI